MQAWSVCQHRQKNTSGAEKEGLQSSDKSIDDVWCRNIGYDEATRNTD